MAQSANAAINASLARSEVILDPDSEKDELVKPGARDRVGARRSSRGLHVLGSILAQRRVDERSDAVTIRGEIGAELDMQKLEAVVHARRAVHRSADGQVRPFVAEPRAEPWIDATLRTDMNLQLATSAHVAPRTFFERRLAAE